MCAVSCKNNNKKQQGAAPAYTVVEAPQVNLEEFATDEDGYVVLFDGTSTKGWRGYGKKELHQGMARLRKDRPARPLDHR